MANNTHQVERILCDETKNGRTLYLIQWKGYPLEQCTWQPAHSFRDPQILRNWEQAKAAGKAMPETQVIDLQKRMDAYALAQEQKSRAIRNMVPRRQRPSGAVPATGYALKGRQLSLRSREKSIPRRGFPAEPSWEPEDRRRPKSKPAVTSSRTHTDPQSEDKLAGRRFRNLRHMGNYRKLLRRECTPDPSCMDLRPPEEWPQRDPDQNREENPIGKGL